MSFKYDNELKDDIDRVICGVCALARNGLITQNADILDLFTPFSNIDGINLHIINYFYKDNIDTEHWVSPMSTNPHLLLPTSERALVEYILNEKWRDEGVLIEALNTYFLWKSDADISELYRVADFFKLSRNELDYWIKEAKEDDFVMQG